MMDSIFNIISIIKNIILMKTFAAATLENWYTAI